MSTLSDSVTIQGDLRVTGTARFADTTGVNRADLDQDANQVYHLRPEDWRTFDALATNLPGTPSSDDLGLVGGTHGTGTPSIQTSDAKATTVTQKARRTFQLPPEYEAGQTVTIRMHAGMLTTVSDGTATVDVAVFKSNLEAGVDGSDLCTTAATTINSLTLADKDFTITPTALAAGDLLDILVTIAITDTATGTAVKGIIGASKVLLDIKG